jgi:CRISPR-associated protein Cmr6
MTLPFVAHRKKVRDAMGAAQEPNLAQLFYRCLHPVGDQKQALAAEFVKVANDVMKSRQLLLPAIQERQEERLTALSNSFTVGSFSAAVSWRLLIGASVGRVWDMGLQLHPLYGVPFLPSSAIKGMLAHYAEEENHDRGVRKSIFGLLDQRGGTIFFDAFCLPGAAVYFEEDVINPHYPKYYRDGVSAPADYCDPIPVKFVAIAGGVKFKFRYAAQASDEPKLKQWLQEALKDYGIGAKTRVGYGRFSSFA